MKNENSSIIKDNYDVFASFIGVLSKLDLKDGLPRVIIMARSRMFKHKWVYPWGKMKLKQGHWKQLDD